ncbi:MAG TPA: 5'/3'-nucleotidase SurE [Gammaproteobacteria bacterium]
MRILLSNDDGYQAQGLRTLADRLADLASITVVAPERNQSGVSNSLTLETPLRVEEARSRWFYVNGTPSDCVHIAITGLLDEDPDMIVSGINHGANLGDDVLYSGTVAAAMEGRFLGFPAVAVSLVLESGGHFATAAAVTRRLIEHMLEHPLPADTILNVNVPDLPLGELRGFEVTRLGFRHKSEPVIKALDPKNRPIYWIGPSGAGQDAGPGTDFHAIANRRVSISPLKIDLTDHRALPDLSRWVEKLQ